VAHREAARRAPERAREALDAVARVREPDGGAAAAVAERLLERLDQAPVVRGAQTQPVLHDGEPAVAGRRRRGALEVDQAVRPERAHEAGGEQPRAHLLPGKDRKSTRLNSTRVDLVCRLLLEKKNDTQRRARS